MENRIVRKANHLIEASYRLSAVEQKIILFLATTISSDDEDFKSYPLRIKTFQGFLGNASNNYERIEEVIHTLMSKNLRIVYPNEEGQKVILNVNWLSSTRYVEGSGIIDIRFDPNLKPFLLQLKTRFTKYRLQNVVQLKSLFSIRIYELLKQYEKIGKRLFDISELRDILGIENDQYRQYTDFRKRVIIAAQIELSEKTDLAFEFEELKKGHSVGQIRFVIRANKQEESVLDEDVIDISPVPLEKEDFQKLVTLLPSDYQGKESIQKLLKTWLDKKGFDYVVRNIEYANDGSNAVNPGTSVGRGSNYRVYLSKALAGDFGLPYKEDNEARLKTEAEAQQKAKEEAKAQKVQEAQTEKEREDIERARVYQESLSPEALETLKAEAVSRLSQEQCELLNKKTPGSGMILKMAMTKICLERMKIS